MSYYKFIDSIAEDTFKETKKWDARDWKNFRKIYYKNYFYERDIIIVNSINKEPDSQKQSYYFRLQKLKNIIDYNKNIFNAI